MPVVCDLNVDVPFVGRVVNVIQLCYPCGFLSSRSGDFSHTTRTVVSAPVQHIFSRLSAPRTRGRFIALISLTAYALHSLVMQWELGITISSDLGFTDFTRFSDADQLACLRNFACNFMCSDLVSTIRLSTELLSLLPSIW